MWAGRACPKVGGVCGHAGFGGRVPEFAGLSWWGWSTSGLFLSWVEEDRTQREEDRCF